MVYQFLQSTFALIENKVDEENRSLSCNRTASKPRKMNELGMSKSFNRANIISQNRLRNVEKFQVQKPNPPNNRYKYDEKPETIVSSHEKLPIKACKTQKDAKIEEN
jgi:hypothetical protein